MAGRRWRGRSVRLSGDPPRDPLGAPRPAPCGPGRGDRRLLVALGAPASEGEGAESLEGSLMWIRPSSRSSSAFRPSPSPRSASAGEPEPTQPVTKFPSYVTYSTPPRPWLLSGSTCSTRPRPSWSPEPAPLRRTWTGRRRWTRPLTALLLATSSLLWSGCSRPEPVPDERARPSLPVRPRPRATDMEIQEWTATGRASLLVREIFRERDYADALVRDGEWER